MIEERLTELGLSLPSTPAPAGSYVPAVQANGFVYTAGQIPFVDGAVAVTGLVGVEVTVEQGQAAARICVLNALAAIDALVGLDAVAQIVKVVGFVASAPGFTDQPTVVNGASDLLVELFGDAGRHARSAVGVVALPRGASVEVELIVSLKSTVSIQPVGL